MSQEAIDIGQQSDASGNVVEHRENLVFKGAEPQCLGSPPLPGEALKLSGPLGEPEPITFEEGKDYMIDYVAGSVTRTESSRIPDWREHPAYGLETFDHLALPYYSNSGFTCSISYRAVDSRTAYAEDNKQTYGLLKSKLPRLFDRLTTGKEAVCVIYGDSISTGAEASRLELSFFGRYIAELRNRYPEADIQAKMKAVGGETSSQGLERIEEVVAAQPDLVLIGYGMNDQNRNSDGSNFVSVQTYERNIRQMIDVIRSRTGADILLLTSCLPNPRWKFASDNVRDYAETLRRIAADSGAALADVQTRWEQVLSTGKSHESLLLNNVNHPNDYGHELYYSVLNQYLD